MKMFAAVIALLALVSTPALAQGNPGPDEFAQALIGNSLIGKTSKNRDYAVYYKADGTMDFQQSNGWTDHGTWRVEGGKFCQKWAVIRDGADYCVRDFRRENGSWSVFNELLNERQEIDLRPGFVSIY